MAIVIDDMAAHLKNTDVQGRLKELAMNYKQEMLQTFIISQTWRSVPLEVRRLYVNKIVLFQVGLNDMTTIISEEAEDEIKYGQNLVKL